MELEARLRAFAAFVRCGSFSRAAREIGISQPVVSKHIADLERNLAGAPRPAQLRAEALLAQAVRGVDAFRERASGSLIVLASGVPANYLLPEVVVMFQRAHPDVQVRIVSGASAQTMDALRAYRAECSRRPRTHSSRCCAPGGAAFRHGYAADHPELRTASLRGSERTLI